jgi:LCP family protein required for cell wall assembly
MTPKNKLRTKLNLSGFFLRLVLLTLFIAIGYVGIFFVKLNKNINKITIQNTAPAENANSIKSLTKSFIKNDTILRGQDTNRINILLLGIGGTDHKGKYLTDTIALVSINPKTYQVAIFSIPRDLYIKIPESNYHTKINALYTYGLRNKKLSRKESVKLTEGAVEEITGEKVHYYAILDFAGFKKVINTLGGINVEVEDDIYDPRYPGPNYSYQTFELSKGFQHLDAETALKYARVRHIKGGDFGRAHRQQQIIASARKKATTLKILANPNKIIKLIDILGDHLKTNISPEEIPAMISLVKNINIDQATTEVLDAWDNDSLLRSTHIPLGGVYAYVLIPKDKNYSQIRKLSKNIFDLKKLDELNAKIKSEDATINLFTPDKKTFHSFKKTLSDWNYKTKNYYDYLAYKKECPHNNDSIISYTGKEKIFTLNDLVERLDAKVYYQKPKSEMQTKHNFIDMALCITPKTAQYFFNQKLTVSNDDNNISHKILNEDGKVLINK